MSRVTEATKQAQLLQLIGGVAINLTLDRESRIWQCDPLEGDWQLWGAPITPPLASSIQWFASQFAPDDWQAQLAEWQALAEACPQGSNETHRQLRLRSDPLWCLSLDAILTWNANHCHVYGVLRNTTAKPSHSGIVEEVHDLIAHNFRLREAERKSIAREIHDEMGQQLTVAKMDLRLLEQSLALRAPELIPQAQQVRAQLAEVVTVSRNVITRLRPPAIDLGIAAALEWLVSEFRRRQQITTTLYLPTETLLLNEETGLHVFRIVQEFLNNTCKYANADRVTVSLQCNEEQLQLHLADTGCGFDPLLVDKGYGLLGMRERVHLLNGCFALKTALHEGVVIDIHIPLTAQQGA